MTTARQVWEGMLTELSKANAPSLLLHEFNYYFNKAINQYVNLLYSTIYDINQQATDNLRVLKATAILTPTESIDGVYKELADYGAGYAKMFSGTYEVNLPDDYLHMLNCICIYELQEDNLCYNKGNKVQVPATRLTSDAWSVIINDYYRRPLPWRPYYFLHNVNTSTDLPTNPVILDDEGLNLILGTDTYEYKSTPLYIKEYKISENEENEENEEDWITVLKLLGDKFTIEKFNELPNKYKRIVSYYNDIADNDYAKEVNTNSNFPRTITLKKDNPLKKDKDVRNISTVNKEAGQRYGNASKVRCEIRYGNDNSVYRLDKVFIDYIKAPQTIRLTKELVDLTEDTSQIMEFPDYVCLEIINELTKLVMARDADPRLQTQVAVTQSIANPAQALTPQQPQTRARQLQG